MPNTKLQIIKETAIILRLIEGKAITKEVRLKD
jgi:hypothetical protein